MLNGFSIIYKHDILYTLAIITATYYFLFSITVVVYNNSKGAQVSKEASAYYSPPYDGVQAP